MARNTIKVELSDEAKAKLDRALWEIRQMKKELKIETWTRRKAGRIGE